VKKYELPSDKPVKEGPSRTSQGLKYVGMGSLVKPGRDAAAAGPSGEGGEAAKPGPPSRPRLASVSTWGGAFRPPGGEASAPKPKKKGGNDEEDDRQIRFTIGGVGQRMTKADFIQEMRKYDKGTRKSIVEHSNASDAVKTLATKDLKTAEGSAQPSTRAQKKTDTPAERGGSTLKPALAHRTVSTPAQTRGRDDTRRSSPASESSSGAGNIPGGGGQDGSEAPPGASSRDAPETAVERRRRLAVLQSVGDDDDEDEAVRETPAERRRRQAALGMSSAAADDDDSDDDDTPRVPPPGGRRGIRFADQPQRG